MSARSSFARGIFVALGAALATPALLLVLAPLLGAQRALAVTCVALVAASLATLGTTLRERVGAALLALTLGLGALVLIALPGRDASFLLAAAVLGVCRAVCFGPSSPPGRARALATELVLCGGGLALAHAVASPGILGAALSVWGFHLVQALFPLAQAGGRVRGGPLRSAGAEPDDFERARARLDAWLEEGASD